MTRLIDISPFDVNIITSVSPRLRYPELWVGCVGAWCPSYSQEKGANLRNWATGDDGVLTGMNPATDWVQWDGKTALDFDGSDDRVVSSSRRMSFGRTDHFAASAWVQTREPYGTIVYEILSTNLAQPTVRGWNFELYHPGSASPTAVYVQIVSDWTTGIRKAINVHSPAGSITSGKPYHVAFSYSGTSLASGVALYINGQRQTNTVVLDTLTDTIIGAASSIAIGRRVSDTYWPMNGLIDDVRIYNRQLSSHEVAVLALRRGVAYERRLVWGVAATGGYTGNTIYNLGQATGTHWLVKP